MSESCIVPNVKQCVESVMILEFFRGEVAENFVKINHNAKRKAFTTAEACNFF